MAKFSKVLIMALRLLAMFSIVLGVLLWSGQNLLAAHIGLGFLVTAILLVLALMGFVKRAIVLAVVGLVLVVALPYAGFKQLPLVFGTGVRLVQIAHVVIVLAALGVAESLNAAIRKAG